MDVLGRALPCESSPPPSRIGLFRLLIPELPGDAWRLLIDFLQKDTAFCHAVCPVFRNQGRIAVYLFDG